MAWQPVYRHGRRTPKQDTRQYIREEEAERWQRKYKLDGLKETLLSRMSRDLQADDFVPVRVLEGNAWPPAEGVQDEDWVVLDLIKNCYGDMLVFVRRE